ncbi:MAG: VWA domain-containing protein [Patulibacter minatonensis]
MSAPGRTGWAASGQPAPADAPRGIDGLLLQAADALRKADVPVGSGELLDASRALVAIPWDDEATVRETLAATLVKTAEHRDRFLALWDELLRHQVLRAALDAQRSLGGSGDGDALTVPGERGEPGGDGSGDGDPGDAQADAGEGESGSAGGQGAGSGLDLEELSRMVQQALGEGSGAGGSVMRDLARLAIQQARQQESGVVGVDVQRIRRMLGLTRGSEGVEELSDAAIRAFTELLRQELEEQRAMRTGDLPPQRALAQLGRDLTIGQSPDDAAVLKAIHALRRQLAVAGRSRRGPRNGPIDLRRTIRTSLQTGGVPIEIIPQREHPRRPQLVALCDVSTSVSGSAVFFLSVVSALADAFSRLRTWAFIEVADEVTEMCLHATGPRDLGQKITGEAKVADHTGYTDYGRVFKQLALELDDVIDRRTTFLVLGDARTNGRDPGIEAFASLTSRAGRTIWLNPEPELYWNYGDSESAWYAKWCEMHRCATAADLTGLAKLLASS